MRRLPAAAAALLALAGCASPLWERTARLPLGPARARLFVPRSFAPLVPGSIYPDRSRPVPSRGLPGVVVLVRELGAREVADALGRRGLVALVAGPGVDPADGFALLRGRAEAGGKLGLFVDASAGVDVAAALGEKELAAAVVAGEVHEVPRAHPPLLVLRVGSPGPAEKPGVSERWFVSPSGKLPPRGLQDAADWLAEQLR